MKHLSALKDICHSFLGTVLGPLLFLLYINDLPENVKANVKLFAGDCLLYKEINNIRVTIVRKPRF
jgi:hypothetical protein